MHVCIRGARVVEPGRVRYADILIRDGVIAEIGRVRASRGFRVVRADGLLALPGFIDIHAHGAAGFDLTEGFFDSRRGEFDHSDAAWRRGVVRALSRLAREGVTRVLLATVAAPEERLARVLRLAADYIENPRNGADGTRLEGVNLEGTFISSPGRAGAQNSSNFMVPDRAVFDRLQLTARGNLRYVNCVPEYGKAAVDLTRHMARRGVLVGAGHTHCTAEQADRCRRAGLSIGVHLLNGRMGGSFKPSGGGNMIEFFLTRPDMYVEIICDGRHVAPSYVLDVIERKGLDRVVLVTDSMFVKGIRGVKEFHLSGRQGEIAPDGACLRIKGDPNEGLFGSVLSMSRAFSNTLSWLTAGLPGVWHGQRRAMPVEDALIGLARATAANPAHLIAIDRNMPGGRASGTGSLEEGKCADIVLAALSGRQGAYRIAVKRAFIEGRTSACA